MNRVQKIVEKLTVEKIRLSQLSANPRNQSLRRGEKDILN
jgi:hypothetical protein